MDLQLRLKLERAGGFNNRQGDGVHDEVHDEVPRSCDCAADLCCGAVRPLGQAVCSERSRSTWQRLSVPPCERSFAGTRNAFPFPQTTFTHPACACSTYRVRRGEGLKLRRFDGISDQRCPSSNTSSNTPSWLTAHQGRRFAQCRAFDGIRLPGEIHKYVKE